MSRIAQTLSALLILIAASHVLGQDSPPQRITGPVSVEPRMTVEPSGDSAALLLPQPPATTGPSASTQPASESSHPVEAPDSEPGSRPLPAIERVPLGQGVVARETGQSEGRSRFGGMAQTIGALAVVLGLILILRFVFVKLSGTAGGLRAQLGAAGRAPSGVLFVLGRYPVSRGMSLVLLQLDQRVLLLSQTSAGFHTLAELSDPAEVASVVQKTRDESGESLSAKFSGMLKQFERDPETLTDMDNAVAARPVRLRHTGTDATIETIEGEPSAHRATGFYEDKPSITTGEDELRSRINRLREFGS